jgi:hypothetical protein
MKKCLKAIVGSSKSKVNLIVLFIFVFIFIFSGVAVAGKTYINPQGGGNGREQSLIATDGILDNVFGLENLLRIDDSLDQIWYPVGETVTVKDVAKWAGYGHDKGWLSGTSGFTFDDLYSIGKGVKETYDPPSEKYSGVFEPGGAFRFALSTTAGGLWSSLESDNVDKLDHMVTWKIIDGTYSGNYVVAFEDMRLNTSDYDYNDNVMMVSGAGVVPEIPAGAVAPVMGLIGFGLWRLRRKATKKKK